MLRSMALLASGLALPLGAPTAAAPTADPADVHTVHVLVSHHLDVGLNKGINFAAFCNGFATKIVQQYFDKFIPRAIRIAKELDGDDEHRFAYTIHPWIASLYVDCVPWQVPDGCPLNPAKLRCPSEEQVAEFDTAVRRGHLLWADSPFNVNAGVVGEPGMFDAMLDIAGALNERYNLTKKQRVWSNVDVNGWARSSIPLLRGAGATALSLCANVGGPSQGHGFSGPEEFVGRSNATMFRWHDPVSDKEILVLYHAAQRDPMLEIPLYSTFNTYAGYTRPDNTIITPGGTALAAMISADNTGPPPSAHVVKAIFKRVRKVFPNAKRVFGSTWDAFVDDIKATEIAALPRYSSEWGDHWISGVPTDPARVATYRAIIRARAACIAAGECQPHEEVLRNFSRFAAKNAEHTQGIQGTGWQPGSQRCIWANMVGMNCPGDREYKNEDFAKTHNAKKNIFPGADDSWLEERLFNELAVQAVPSSHPLAAFLRDEIAALQPRSPGLMPPPYDQLNGPTVTCPGEGDTGAVTVQFSRTGSIDSLSFGSESGNWSRLLDLRYITSKGSNRNGVTCDDASKCPNPAPGAWAPSLRGFSFSTENATCRVSLQLAFNESLHDHYGAPAGVSVEYVIHPARRRLDVALTWQNKTATRLPESMTVFNRPLPRAGYGWEMDKLGEWVSPSNVTLGGQQYQHVAWSGIRYAKPGDRAAPGLFVGTLDAVLLCPVLNVVADTALTPETSLQKACFEYKQGFAGDRDPQLTDAMIDGLGINLHNNRMGISGFPQWYPFGVGDRYQKQDETTQFRFVIEEQGERVGPRVLV